MMIWKLFRNGLPLLAALFAAVILILAPFWASSWYHTPFLGLFIEPNMVVSQIGEKDWPAIQAGIRLADRLLTVNGQPVQSVEVLESILRANGDTPVRLVFERPQVSAIDITVQPQSAHFSDLIKYFGIPYLVGLVLLFSGLWVYRMGGNQRSVRAYLFFTASLSLMSSGFFDMNTTHHFTLGWTWSLSFAAASLAYLAMVFPKPLYVVDRFPPARFIPWIITLPLVFAGGREILFPSDPRGYVRVWLWDYVYFGVAVLLFLGVQAYRIARSDAPVLRQQSRIIIFGAALSFGPALILYLFPSALGQTPEFETTLYFPLLTFFPISVSYAILRYRMLNVDRLLSQAINYLLTSMGVVLLFYLLVAVVSWILQSMVNPSDPVILALYIFLLVILLNPLRQAMQRGIDRVFYRSHVDYQKTLAFLSQQLASSTTGLSTLHTLETEILKTLQPRHFCLYLYNDDEGNYHLQTDHPAPEVTLRPESALIQLINHKRSPLWLPDKGLHHPDLQAELTTLTALDCLVFVPLYYEERLIGFFGLGDHLSGGPYTRDELDFLAAVAAQSTLALENTRLFSNLEHTLVETTEIKNLMDDIFASIASGVITTDLQHKITLFNRASEQILGISAARIVGKSLDSLLPSHAQRLLALTDASIQRGEITQEEITPELPERGSLYLRLSCTPLRDANFGTKGATLVIDDLTEQHRLEAERERIRQTFGRVVAPRVRDKLLEDPGNLRLDGIRQSVAVLFADLHNFTLFSERTPPESLFSILNSYLSLAARAILDEEGTLDKFMGDAVMALWNTPDEQPDPVLRAVRSSLAILEAVRVHQATLEVQYRLDFRISITFGEAMVGNLGTNELFNFTAIGDTVNLAQRLEALAEPGQVLLSEEAYQQVADKIVARQLATIQVKGRVRPVVVYELAGMSTM